MQRDEKPGGACADWRDSLPPEIERLLSSVVTATEAEVVQRVIRRTYESRAGEPECCRRCRADERFTQAVPPLTEEQRQRFKTPCIAGLYDVAPDTGRVTVTRGDSIRGFRVEFF